MLVTRITLRTLILRILTFALCVYDEQQEDWMPEKDKSDENNCKNSESSHRRGLESRAYGASLGGVRQHVCVYRAHRHGRGR